MLKKVTSNILLICPTGSHKTLLSVMETCLLDIMYQNYSVENVKDPDHLLLSAKLLG